MWEPLLSRQLEQFQEAQRRQEMCSPGEMNQVPQSVTLVQRPQTSLLLCAHITNTVIPGGGFLFSSSFVLDAVINASDSTNSNIPVFNQKDQLSCFLIQSKVP